jgi:uncharacterized protein CbrC (UPF0167 family)
VFWAPLVHSQSDSPTSDLAAEILLHEHDEYGWTLEQHERYVDRLDAGGEPIAYLLRCLRSGTHLAFSDFC